MPTKRVAELEPGDRIVLEGSPASPVVTSEPHQGRRGMVFVSIAYDALDRGLPAKTRVFLAFPSSDDEVDVE
jgi:hypothetical protein